MNRYFYNTQLPDVLSSQEEYNLFKKVELGNKKAVKEIAKHNIRLVIYIAKKFSNENELLEDLISEGNIGLMKAIKNL